MDSDTGKAQQAEDRKFTISVALPQDLHERTRDLAAKSQMSQAAVIRQALQAHLDKMDKNPSDEAAARIEETLKRLDAVADRIIVATYKLKEAV